MSRLWSMFRFRSFRIFCEKIAIFRTFDHWSEILLLSAGRPISQGVCPALLLAYGCSMLAVQVLRNRFLRRHDDTLAAEKMPREGIAAGETEQLPVDQDIASHVQVPHVHVGSLAHAFLLSHVAVAAQILYLILSLTF